MATYKVPQDVEADDKLIGPFSFRQFIYLVIAIGAIALAWGLSRLFIGLFILPLPLVLFFGALALPLRKDQPMEIYLAALVNFYLKPRKHIWDPAPPATNVVITVPKTVEVQRTKGLSTDEVARRLGYLSQVVDTHGWSTRGVSNLPIQNSSMNDELYYEAQTTQDIMDEQGTIRRDFDARLRQSDQQHRQDMINTLKQPQQTAIQPQDPGTYTIPQTLQPRPPVTVTPRAPQGPTTVNNPAHLSINPYPSSMHQAVIQPASQQPASPTPTAQPQPAVPSQTPQIPPESTSETTVSPDIIELANNNDISVETMARQAKRLETKKQGEEVVISLH